MVAPTPPRIQPVRIEEQMRTAYLDYAMSVIVARALPDVRDGLKPVQRRILYTMHEQGMRPNAAYRKCARVVGDVLGKYHPHGDAPVYEALVRLAQDFSMRVPLVDGQGNFGSVDGDPPAAMRYTECRLAPLAEEMLADIDLDTVDFVPNYDGSQMEPTVLPARLPNLLLNGASGIAVGMATNIPPHNLGELCDGIVLLIDNPDATIDDLVQRIPGPDFPTGGIVKNVEGIRSAYATGQGRIVMEARTSIEEARGGRFQLVVTELPYQVNKAALVEKIAHLARDKKIDGISDVRDESSREGLRVVIELRRDAQPTVVRSNLLKHTALRTAFAANMLALVDGQPQVLGLRRTLQLYIRHRQEVVRRRSEYLLKKAQERAHILEGLRKALSMLDAVIAIVRNAPDVDAARQGLMQQLDLTEVQAQAILEMQLRRLTALDRQKIDEEYEELQRTMAELQAILHDPARLMAVIREETLKLKEKFATPRRSEISTEEVTEFSVEELVPHQDVVITLSSRGYIKRIPYDTYKLQRRGGKGVRGMTTRDGDDIQHLAVADTHDTLLFFTTRGRVYPLRCFEVPGDSSRTTRGTPLVGLVPLVEGERVNAIIGVRSLQEEKVLLLATRKGEIKGMALSDLSNIRARGLVAMDLEPNDDMVAARIADPDDDVIMVTANGQSIRFPVAEVPSRSRAAGGVKGIRLMPRDEVVAMDIVVPDAYLLVVSSKGFGKLTLLNRYPRQKRRGLGVRTFKVITATGKVAGAHVVRDPASEELVLISTRGQVIRIPLKDVSIQGRSTQGVTIWRDKQPDDTVASLAVYVERERTAEGTLELPRPTGGANGHTPAEALEADEEDEDDEGLEEQVTDELEDDEDEEGNAGA